MKLEAKLINMTYDYEHKGTKFEFFCYGNEMANLEQYLDKEINLDLKGQKRTNTANSYLWVLLGQLQEKLQIPKEDIYKQYIFGCGSYEVYQMPLEAFKTFYKAWASLGTGWVCDVDSTKDDMATVFAYRGSSDYSKEEMSVLLGQVVNDCIAQGIPVKRKEDIESLIERWG